VFLLGVSGCFGYVSSLENATPESLLAFQENAKRRERFVLHDLIQDHVTLLLEFNAVDLILASERIYKLIVGMAY